MPSRFLSKLLMYLLCIAFAFPAYAFERVGGISSVTGSQAEFRNSNKQNRLLIEVNMISGVQQKGIHQVPDNTNLVEMVSLAGGPDERADISEVHIKRKTRTGYATISYNLEKLVQQPNFNYPNLEDGDVVMIQQSSTDSWIRALSIVGITLGIIVSTFIIKNEFKK